MRAVILFGVWTHLDEVDRRLLAAVQAEARLPQAALGARVGLSAAAVNRRLWRLTEGGFITRTTAVLAPELLGHPLTVIAQVEVESEQTDPLDRMQAAFVSCPQVQQCYCDLAHRTTSWCFVVRDMQQYLELTRRQSHSRRPARVNTKRDHVLTTTRPPAACPVTPHPCRRRGAL